VSGPGVDTVLILAWPAATPERVEVVALEADEDDPVVVNALHVDSGSKRVTWMRDWTAADGLVEHGILRRVAGGAGTYGHFDYYLEAA
jgi:hypothetical protein